MPDKEEWLQYPLSAERQWLPWIREQLKAQGVDAITPELPLPYNPEYQAWKKAFEQALRERPVDKETDLIGHSCGGGFLVRWLSENPVQTGKVVLVAPWLDPKGFLKTGMFDFTIDKAFPTRARSVEVFISSDDEEDIEQTVEMLREVPGIHFSEFTNKGHFVTESMGGNEFPELLEYLK